MIYQRGSRGSYDRWAQEVGDDSYAWDNILPFFERSVSVTKPNNDLRAMNASVETSYAAYNKSGGPLKVSWPNFAMPFGSYGLPAMRHAGSKALPDFSTGDLMGATYTPSTIDPVYQTRSSSETSFLQFAIEMGLDLTVYPMTQALRVLFDDQKCATGVQVQSAGQNYTLHAKHEVILSAGVFHSPQLLMVSGVGPRQKLEEYGISVVAERPGVGQEMHDSTNVSRHPMPSYTTHKLTVAQVGGIAFPVSVISTAILDRDAAYSATAVELFNTNGTGILTNEGGDVLSFENFPTPHRSQLSNSTLSKFAQWPADWPEYELVLSSSGKSFEATDRSAQNIVSIGILMTATSSRGNVTIRSASILEKPIISTNWLLDEADQEVAVLCYRRAREIWSFMSGVTIGPEVSPGANVTTDGQLLEFIKSKGVAPIHHATSTCRMGRANDTMAVVDSLARVIGVQKLRVIDSSSFRFTPPGHTQAATYAHAEKLVHNVVTSCS